MASRVMCIRLHARRWGLFLGLSLALAACGGGEQPQAQGRGNGRGGANRVVPVQVARAELGTAARTVTTTGTVEPLRTVGVNSQLAGAVRTVLVEEGSQVRQGAVLARMDAQELDAQLRSAEAALEVARRASERAQQLHEQRIVTDAEFERDRAAYAAARATRDQLRTRLGYATVNAPIAGTVLEQRVESGDVVGAQQRLFSIADVSTLVVRVPVSERDVAALREGGRAEVALDALPNRTLQGRIRRIFPAADSATRLVPVEVALDAPSSRQARPGFLARVTFALAPREGVLMVPAGAVLTDASGSAVFLVREGRASRRRVERGGTFQGRVEVVTGLVPGDTVVVAGNADLRDGAQVRIVTPPGTDAPASREVSRSREGASAEPAPGTRLASRPRGG